MLNFTLNEPVELSFKVGIAGTGAVPQRVAVVLKQGGGPGLTFEARGADEGAWVASINVPTGSLSEGPAQLSIEVLLNNKLFVPVRETVEIVPAQPAAPAFEVPAPAPAPAPEAPAPAPEPTAPATVPALEASTKVAESPVPTTPSPPAPVLPAVARPAPVATEEKKVQVKVSLLKETERVTHKRKVGKRAVAEIFKVESAPRPNVEAAAKKLAEANKRLERKPFGKLVEESHPPVRVEVTSQPAFHIKKTKIVTR